MSKISSMMDVGKRSMMNSQTSLQTVAHNIANKSTEGYSRQRVEVLTNEPASSGNLRIGMGARAGVVTRINNPWLEKQIERENIAMGYMDARSDSLGRVEQVYNEQVNKGLNQYIGEFFNSFRELANNPESLASRTLVRESSVALVKDFQRVNEQLRSIQVDLDGQIKTTVGEINEISKEIANLNEKILQIEIQKIPANDERDRRDILLKNLGDKIDITWAEGKDGNVTVTAARTGVLVSGTEFGELQTSNSSDRDRAEVFFLATANSNPTKITEQITGGKIGGALEVRDQTIEDCLEQVDNLAYSLGTEINNIHKEGFDRYGKKGENFFNLGADPEGVSSDIRLNSAIFDDVSKISVASRPRASGDGTIANAISAMQYQKLMDDGHSTFDDYYNTQVGQIGAVAMRASKSRDAQGNIISQLNNIRESISGVSLDEEATKMIEFQKTFEASARIIKTADEMFDTVLSLKRM